MANAKAPKPAKIGNREYSYLFWVCTRALHYVESPPPSPPHLGYSTFKGGAGVCSQTGHLCLLSLSI